MRSEDSEIMKEYWPKWRCLLGQEVITVAALSPSSDELGILNGLNTNITKLMIGDWNLNNSHDGKYDLIIASNIFMASPNPQLWFDNVLST